MKHSIKKDHITKKRIKYRGICRAARELGLTRVYVYNVLEGNLESKKLKQTEIFKKLKEGTYEAV